MIRSEEKIILDSPIALGALFLGLAGMWVLQMQLAKKQAVRGLVIWADRLRKTLAW